MASEQQQSPPSIPILRPKPRRPLEPASASNEPSAPSSNRRSLESASEAWDGLSENARNQSFLNLTSSTLLGIYAPTALGEQPSESQTPWGTGAETPARNGSIDLDRGGLNLSLRAGRETSMAELEARLLRTTGRPPAQRRRSTLSIADAEVLPHHARRTWYAGLAVAALRLATLFLFGVAYGTLVAHLHDHGQIAPVTVDGIDRARWSYLVFWGVAGIGIGSLLPWVDFLWSKGCSAAASSSPAFVSPDKRRTSNNTRSERDDELETAAAAERSSRRAGLPVEWHDVVRSVGAFVGVAFAIRKLAWSSTLQLSVTLALANPFLWYLLDRTRTGFALSTLIGCVGTAVLFAVNPAMIPVPAPAAPHAGAPNGTAAGAGYGGAQDGLPRSADAIKALVNSESVAVVTWTASVLFCSCVCFGNIGRLLVTGKR